MKQVFGLQATQGANPIDATQPIANVSERYGFVSTRNILDVFESKGWVVEQQVKAKVRDVSKDGHQRHLVTLKHDSYQNIPGLTTDNNSSVRLCLFNSHDLTTRLMISFGVFRGACLNLNLFGAVLRHFGAVHSKSIVSKVDTGIEFMTNGIPELIDTIQRLQGITMSQAQRNEFARLMIDERLKNVHNVLNVDYSVIDRLQRSEDSQNDAYTVFNRVQEYIIRGGVPYTYRRDVRNEVGDVVSSNIINTTTRKVSSISTQLSLSEALATNILNVTGVKVAA